jgi:hypothetical protein
MSPREPQRTPPKTLAINSSRDMLEKLRREIDRLAGSIIRQDIVDNGLNAAMTAWHLTDWVWKEIQGSTRRPTLTARAGAPIRELKQFQEPWSPCKRLSAASQFAPRIGRLRSMTSDAGIVSAALRTRKIEPAIPGIAEAKTAAWAR